MAVGGGGGVDDLSDGGDGGGIAADNAMDRLRGLQARARRMD